MKQFVLAIFLGLTLVFTIPIHACSGGSRNGTVNIAGIGGGFGSGSGSNSNTEPNRELNTASPECS